MSSQGPYPPYGPGREPDNPWETSDPPHHGRDSAPPYGWGPPAPTHPQGTTVLVLGILSVVGLSFLGPFAWIMGRRALREIDAQPQPTANRGSVLAGLIMGIIATAFLAIGVVGFIFFFGFILLVMA